MEICKGPATSHGQERQAKYKKQLDCRILEGTPSHQRRLCEAHERDQAEIGLRSRKCEQDEQKKKIEDEAAKKAKEEAAKKAKEEEEKRKKVEAECFKKMNA